MKFKAIIRVISYIGATLLATAVILLLLAVIKVPVDKSGDNGEKSPAVSNPTENQKTNTDDRSAQAGSGQAGENPSTPTSQTSTATAGPTQSGVQNQAPAPGPSNPQQETPPASAADPQPTALDVLIDTVQGIVPRGVL